MKFTGDGIEGTHPEFMESIWAYVRFQVSQGMSPYAGNQMGQHLAQYLGFLQDFASTTKCKACDGKGHNNLVKLGSKTPEPCSDCKGTGRVALVVG